MKWPDGRYFEGMFKEGIQHGPGIYIKQNRDKIEGQWERGKLINSSSRMHENYGEVVQYQHVSDARKRSGSGYG